MLHNVVGGGRVSHFPEKSVGVRFNVVSVTTYEGVGGCQFSRKKR